MTEVIRVENLSKLYHIGDGSRHDSLRDLVSGFFNRKPHIDRSEFWALRDISLTVNQGETLGIIGRNGAGKSTLLKILSRITKPTKGYAEIRGRVGSLLEVGTGFHGELSGRENIYLNGAILGMKRAEITSKFDEIVAFSEVEKFLDTPVKHYSSGMYMRLAFSVAAHLDPEVLIVDEVLAVGDADFQKKCLGKMNEVSRTGRTVIFVSHQMGSVAQLCKKAVLLDNGSLVMQDHTNLVIEHYINHGKPKLASYTADASPAGRELYIQSATVTNDDGIERTSFRHDEGILINVRCTVNKMIRGAELRMVVRDGRGMIVFITDAELSSLGDKIETFDVDYKIPANTLRPNNYFLELSLFVPHQYIIESVADILFFSIFDSGTKYAHSEGVDYGVIFSPVQWTVKRSTSRN